VSDRYDTIVIGAGILGLATARELLLRRPDTRLAVLDREPAVARHQTGHNSGVVHGGIYYTPGSLKARLAVDGARRMREYCQEHEIAYRECGKLIVATDASELPRLEELQRRGQANGVPGLRRVDGGGLREIEPHATGVAALHSPKTAVVDYGAVARSLAQDVTAAGARILHDTTVLRIADHAASVDVHHAGGVVSARRGVVCAGLWADRLARAAGAPRDPVIIPFRGAYRELRAEHAHLVRGMIYPVPDPELPFLGVHLTRGVHGEVHVGPTALLVGARDAYRLMRVVPRDLATTLGWPGTWRVARRWWRTGAREALWAIRPSTLAREAARYVPAIEPGDLLAGPAGVRAQAVARDGTLVDDFLLQRHGNVVHVRNAPSPAATAALALAELIADRCEA